MSMLSAHRQTLQLTNRLTGDRQTPSDAGPSGPRRRTHFATRRSGRVGLRYRLPRRVNAAVRYCLNPPGWVPAMKASVIAPGDEGSVELPVALSTDANTMLPGASKDGGSLRSPIHDFMISIQIGSAASEPVWL